MVALVWTRRVFRYRPPWLSGRIVPSDEVGVPVFRSWTVQRRRLDAGVDDGLEGAEWGAFGMWIPSESREVPIDLTGTELALGPARGDEWTTDYNGLPVELRLKVDAELAALPGRSDGDPDADKRRVEGARYHVTEVRLVPGQPIWYQPKSRVLTDVDPARLTNGIPYRIALFGGIGAILLAAGLNLLGV